MTPAFVSVRGGSVASSSRYIKVPATVAVDNIIMSNAFSVVPGCYLSKALLHSEVTGATIVY